MDVNTSGPVATKPVAAEKFRQLRRQIREFRFADSASAESVSSSKSDEILGVALTSVSVSRRSLPAIELLVSPSMEIPDAIVWGRRIFGDVQIRVHHVSEVVAEHWYRPAQPGRSLAHFNNTAGTLGCLVRGRKRKRRTLFAMSCLHVLGSPIGATTMGDPVLQPGPADGGIKADHTLGAFAAEASRWELDCAIAQVAKCNVHPLIPKIGRVARVQATPYVGMLVKKFGRTTGFRRGRVVSIETKTRPFYSWGARQFLLNDAIQIEGIDDDFSQRGDSGSLVVTESGNQPLGIIVAGEPASANQPKRTYVTPIRTALDALGVRIARTVAEIRGCR